MYQYPPATAMFQKLGEDNNNLCLFPKTRVLTALMPRFRNLHKTDLRFSTVVPLSSVHEHILLIATDNYVTKQYRDDDAPTEVVARLLRVGKPGFLL